MAILGAFIDGKFTVAGVDLSDHVHKVIVKSMADELDSTAMGGTYHTRVGGLKDYSVDVEFNQDFSAAKVDATIFPILGTVVAFTAKATTAINSATNPEYQGSVLIKEYTPLDGSVGDLGRVSVSWPGSGTLTRATA